MATTQQFRNRAGLFALVAFNAVALFGLVTTQRADPALLQVRSPLLCILYMAFLLSQLFLASHAVRISAARLFTNAMATASTMTEIP